MRKILALFLYCVCLSAASIEAQDERPSVALVLAGGGARGFAHIAILEIIEELGIPIDMIIGVSSGAIVGGLYAAGYSPAMILELLDNRDWSSFFTDRPVFPFSKRNPELPLAFRLNSSAGTSRQANSSKRKFPSGAITPDWGKGFSSGQRAYNFFKSLLVKIPSNIEFDKLPIPFRAGVVEVPLGKFELLDQGDLAEAIRASMGIQGAFEPFIIDGRSYVDGGLLNNLPVREVRELGFDIVIAIDLYDFPQEYSTAPMDLPDLMPIIYSNLTSREHHDLADLVLFPLPQEISTMDFSKGPDIYSLVINQKDRLAALLEPVRERIAPTDAGSHQSYRDLASIMPQWMAVTGELSQDRSFMEREFSRLVMGKPLEEENITAFLESIYEIGNYQTVIVRTNFNSGNTADAYLELILYPRTENKILLRTGFSYEGTFSSRSFGRSALRFGIEFQAKDGFSLFLASSLLGELSFGISLLKPLGPNFFLAAEADVVRAQTLIINGILDRKETIPDRLLYFRGAFTGGLRLNRHNSLSLWPEYFWFVDEDLSYAMAVIGSAYTHNSLNHVLFPSRGFFFRIENRLSFTPDEKELFNVASIDLAALIPLSRNFSLGASAFGSSLFGKTELIPKIAVFDAGKAEWVFFPHVTGVFFGKNRAALSFSLQIEPWDHLTIFGGRLVFPLVFAAGRAGSFEWSELLDFGKDSLIWNASFGVVLVISENFGLQIRAGVGSGSHQMHPFVSLGIGMSGFHRRLF